VTTFLDLIPKFENPALCATQGHPDDWHPPSGGAGVAIAERAKTVCRQCPSLKECRDYALANPEVKGVWGGLSGHERKAMRQDTPEAKRLRAAS
jgi:hypothetical protein